MLLLFYIQRVNELQIFVIKLMLNENKANELQQGNIHFFCYLRSTGFQKALSSYKTTL